MRHFRRRCVPLPFGRARVASTRRSSRSGFKRSPHRLTPPSRATRSQANLSFHGVEYIVTISSARDDVLSVEVRPRARRANDRRTRVRRPCLPRAPDDDGLLVAAQVIVEIAADAFPRPPPPRRLSKKTTASVGAATSPRDTSRTSPPRRAASRSTASSSRCSSPRRWTTRIPSSSTSSPTPTSRRSRASVRAGAPPRAAPSSKTNNKRYLILTYAAEFDRVHYPLPLLHEDAPSADALRAHGGATQTQARNSPQGVRGRRRQLRRRRHRLRGTQNHRRGEHQTSRGERYAQDAGAAAAARVVARRRGRGAPRRRVSEARRSREVCSGFAGLRARGKPSRGAQGGHHRTSSDASRARRREPRGAGGADGRGERGVVPSVACARRQKELDAARHDLSRRRGTERANSASR